MKPVILMLALAGCYGPTYRDCDITCASNACPAGFVCDLGVCRIEGFTGACDGTDAGTEGLPGDVDSDGVPDADDNCRDLANSNQADEDGDLRGDVCDPCPPLRLATDNNDSDGDGVGDSCDPNVTTMGDRISLFEGFANNSRPMGASEAPMGAWTFANGNASIVASEAPATGIVWAIPASPAETVRVGFTITGFGATLPRAIGAVDQYDLGVGTSVVCARRDEPGGIGELSLIGPNFDMRTTAQPLAMQAYQPQVTRRGGMYICSEPTAPQVVANGGQPLSTPYGGLYAFRVSADFHWIMVVSSP